MNDESSLARNAAAAAISSGSPKTAERNVHESSRRPLGVLREQFDEQRSVDRPRRQGVDPHSGSGELHAELTSHGEHPALGRRVRDLRGRGSHRRHEGRGVDDRSLGLVEHVGQDLLAAQEHRREVDRLDSVPSVDAGVEDRVVVRRRDASIVEGDIDAPVGVLRRREHRGDIVGVGHVGADEEAVDCRSRRLTGDGIEIADHDSGSLVGESACRGQPDTACPAGDHGDASFEPTALALTHGVLFSRRVTTHRVLRSVRVQPSVLMKTFLVSVKASSASGPSSRPSPERLKPPKGVE